MYTYGVCPFDPEPAALFLTWTTYGSWLPGDGRGWTDDIGLWRESNPRLYRIVSGSMRQAPVRFDVRQRWTVERAVMEHCRYATWVLHALQCRVTHVHVVVSAPGCRPRLVLGRLKAWCTKALRAVDQGSLGCRMWTRGGSTRWLADEEALMRAVEYVRDAQDGGRFDRQA